MDTFDWKERYGRLVQSAREAMAQIKSGDSIFIGTGCGQPQHLVRALIEHGGHIYDAHIIHLLTMGEAPYANEAFREKFKMNSFFIADNVRGAFEQGIGDYTPILLSDIPRQFESGRIPLDVALISVTPPDVNGLCSLGVSVDIVKSAAANARRVIAQVNCSMPRTLGNSFIHVNSLDAMVPFDEPVITVEPAASSDVLRRIGRNLGRLVEDGSTIECGIGRIPQAMAEFLHDKKTLAFTPRCSATGSSSWSNAAPSPAPKKPSTTTKSSPASAWAPSIFTTTSTTTPSSSSIPPSTSTTPLSLPSTTRWSASTSGWKST
jgi:acyl-CoA hydrolase